MNPHYLRNHGLAPQVPAALGAALPSALGAEGNTVSVMAVQTHAGVTVLIVTNAYCYVVFFP